MPTKDTSAQLLDRPRCAQASQGCPDSKSSTSRRRRTSRAVSWRNTLSKFWLFGCIGLAAVFAWQGPETQESTTSGTAAQQQTDAVDVRQARHLPPSKPRFANIEEIRVGQRVWADNPDVDSPEETAVDPSTWKLVRMCAETVWEDSTVDDINVETIVPPEWIELFDTRVGASVPIPLDLQEMGLPEDLLAKVLAIERCPPIEDGRGRVVLTTVNHLNRDVYELTVEDERSQAVTTRPTGFHKFYRKDDQAWVSTKDLRAGDRLRDSRERPVRVVSARRLPGTHRVYNMTVEGEHVYHVTGLGLLTHNMDCSRVGTLVDELGLDPSLAPAIKAFLEAPEAPGLPKDLLLGLHQRRLTDFARKALKAGTGDYHTIGKFSFKGKLRALRWDQKMVLAMERVDVIRWRKTPDLDVSRMNPIFTGEHGNFADFELFTLFSRERFMEKLVPGFNPFK